MAVAKAEIVDVQTLCRTFPKVPDPMVNRDTSLRTLDLMYESGISVVLLDGEPNTGKTTLLAQYALEHPTDCVALFVNPLSRLTSEPYLLLTDLYNQLTWLVEGKEVHDDRVAEPDSVLLMLHKLDKRLRRQQSRKLLFVIDGLDEVPESDVTKYHEIFSVLPFGSTWARFIVSGPPSVLPRALQASNQYRCHTLVHRRVSSSQ